MGIAKRETGDRHKKRETGDGDRHRDTKKPTERHLEKNRERQRDGRFQEGKVSLFKKNFRDSWKTL